MDDMAAFQARMYKAARETPSKCSKVVYKTAYDIQAKAAQIAPVRTGFLRNSIQVSPVDSLEAHVNVGAEYGQYVEYGTSRMAARPYIGPAVEDNIPKMLDALEKVIMGAW